METKNYTGAIPEQKEGSVINAKSAVTLADQAAAITLFEKAKQRLLDVNNWQEMAGKPLAHFHLTDLAGNDVPSPVQETYHFKIDTPGPGTSAGEGCDWVRVEAIETYKEGDVESIAVRVRPSSNPSNKHHDNTTAHFYSDESTSTFIVTREGLDLTALVCDRNIKINKDSGKVTDQVRNLVFGLGGISIFSKIQWKSLTDGLLGLG